MMKWLRGKRGIAAKDRESFLDYDDSHDPWDSPTVRFFGKKLKEEERPSRRPEESVSLADRFVRDEDSPFWDSSRSRKKFVNDMTSPRLEAASRRHEREQAEPVVITPQQRLYDISPEEFKDRQPRAFRSGPTLSPPREKIQGKDIRFSHDEREPAPSSPQRVFVAEEEMGSYRERVDGIQGAGIRRQPQRPPEGPSRGRPYERVQHSSFYEETAQRREAIPDSAARYSRSLPQDNPQEFFSDIPHFDDKAQQEAQARAEERMASRRALISWLKIIAALFALLLIVVVLFGVWRTSRPLVDEEGLLTIPSPQHIKVKPTEPDRALIPYQDELIYGQLDNLPEPEVEDPIYPVQEEVPKDDAPPGKDEPKPVLSVDEYLDEGDRPHNASSASPMMASSSSSAQRTQEKLAKFVEEENQRKMNATPSVKGMPSTRSTLPFERSTHLLPASASAEVRTVVPASPKRPIPLPSPVRQVREATPKPKTALASPAKNAVYLQLGTLTSIESARSEAARLAAKYKVFSPYRMIVRSTTTSTGRNVYLILLGPVESAEKARALLRQTSGQFTIRP